MQTAADLTGFAIVTSVALLGGLALTRIRQPAIVGYILAGIVLGPGGFGLVPETGAIHAFAELGVLLLLFVVGMELSLRSFVAVLRISVLTMLLQVLAGLAVAFALGAVLAWPAALSIVVGFMVSLSSTAVAVKLLADMGELHGPTGRVSVGVLVAQDLAVVPMLIAVGVIGGTAEGDASTAVTVGAGIGLLAFVIFYLSRRERVRLPLGPWIAGRADMVSLAALAFCFSAAAASGVVGLSPAYGAFLAGLVVGNSTGRASALRASRPIEGVLMVAFFLAVGLLIDLDLVADNAALVAVLVIAVTFLKTAINVAALHVLGEPWERAFPAGLAMGQIGEFSFVLAATALAAGLLPEDLYKLAIAVIALSLLVSPLWLLTARRFHRVAADGVVNVRIALREAFRREITVLGRGAALVRLGAAGVRAGLRRLTGRRP